eukprot:scaffold85_cov145-Alexandrium_tamarense.AAC.34
MSNLDEFNGVEAAAGDGEPAQQPPSKKSKNNVSPQTRQVKLEQNRKAARESRRRKKVLVEELQRSVIFFTRGTLH